jgi:glutathione S-transferase
MKLYIGNKNYSSWSMRPWVLMRHFGIRFDEVMLRFDSFDADSQFKQRIGAVSPAGRVPVLVLDNGLAVWDSLAIAETLAEHFPSLALWPQDVAERARARSLSAEMHSGFGALRQHCPMNIEASLPEVGARVWQAHEALQRDVARITQSWSEALNGSGGPFLFGSFGIVDAMFAPVCFRLTTYALPMPPQLNAYVQRVQALPAVREWVRDALAERDFIPFDEPYRQAPG